MIQETHEDKDTKVQVVQHPTNNHTPRGFKSIVVANLEGVPKGINFPKDEFKKFDEIDVFTWVNQIEKYF